MNRQTTPTNHALLAAGWLSVGVIVACLFATAQLLPLQVTICLLAALTVCGILLLQITSLSIMTRLFVVLYVLPFSATLGYLFDRNFVWWQTPTNVLLCQNHQLINEMLTVVTVGLCGLIAGIEIMAVRMGSASPAGRGAAFPAGRGQPARAPIRQTVLALPVAFVLLAISFVCSWLWAPEESIFTAAYGSAAAGAGIAKDVGMNASYLISYMIIVLLVVDAEREQPGSQRRKLKLAATLLVTSYIVVVLQLLRGDRECAGLLAALVMLYVTSPSMEATRDRLKRSFQQLARMLKIFVPVAFCVAIFLAMGSLRHSASKSSSETSGIWDTVVEGATQNTWTAVALNNLGLAADYNYRTIEFLYGQTYVDYFLSLPPGAITMALGYERPMESPDSNPSMWYFGLIAAGGMHPAVVPFRNFGIWGVLGILVLVGSFISFCESYNELGTLSARLLYGCLGTSCMLWFWYGDMNLIRTVMGWGILFWIHAFTAFRSSSIRLSSPLRTNLPSRKPATALT